MFLFPVAAAVIQGTRIYSGGGGVGIKSKMTAAKIIAVPLFEWGEWDEIMCFRIGTVGGKFHFSHADQMRSWYLISRFSQKFSRGSPSLYVYSDSFYNKYYLNWRKNC